MAFIAARRLDIQKRSLNASTVAVILFFSLLLGVGLAVYRDFGISWDEEVQFQLGIQNYRYILHGNPELLSNQDRYYGPLFELVLQLASFRTHLSSQQLYFNRHLITFLAFFAGCLSFFWIARRLARSTWLALAGTLFLALSPRIFADAFYNSKDIPFLVFYTFSLGSMLWFLDRPSPMRALLHGGITAAMLDIRLPGLVIPALTVVGLGIEIFARRISLRKAILGGGIYLLACAGCLFAIWPILWHDPLGGFITAVQQMSHYPHIVEELYQGKYALSNNLPWHYIPVWMGITTPLLYLALFVIGLAALATTFLQQIRETITPDNRDLLLVLCALFGPLAAVIVLHSVLYNAWRQMFFIYSPFLLIALFGLKACWEHLSRHFFRQLAQGITVVFLAAGLLPTAAWMIANHPFENAYFNRLAGPDMQTILLNYMGDYWGLSYRAGLEYIARTDPAPHINIAVQNYVGQINWNILSPQDQGRIKVFVVRHGENPKYYIYVHYLPLTDRKITYPEVFSVQIGNGKIMTVYQLTP